MSTVLRVCLILIAVAVVLDLVSILGNLRQRLRLYVLAAQQRIIENAARIAVRASYDHPTHEKQHEAQCTLMRLTTKRCGLTLTTDEIDGYVRSARAEWNLERYK